VRYYWYILHAHIICYYEGPPHLSDPKIEDGLFSLEISYERGRLHWAMHHPTHIVFHHSIISPRAFGKTREGSQFQRHGMEPMGLRSTKEECLTTERYLVQWSELSESSNCLLA
jgi:hypothetical protein